MSDSQNYTDEELAWLHGLEMRDELHDAGLDGLDDEALHTMRCRCGHAASSHYAGWCSLKAKCGCKSFRSRAEEPYRDVEPRIEAYSESYYPREAS